MKKIILTCLLTLAFAQVQAQIPSENFVMVNGDTVYTVVQKQPEFSGGAKGMQKFMNTNYKTPEMVKKQGINGKVFVKFVISKEGKTQHIEILNGMKNCEPCNEEALRLVKMMPDWIAGEQDGKAVAVMFVLPIAFKAPTFPEKKR